jgi:choline kinase
MIKKAAILAAGRGTRLQPLIYDLPKPIIHDDTTAVLCGPEHVVRRVVQ